MAQGETDKVPAMQREGTLQKLSLRISRPLSRLRGHRPDEFRPQRAIVLTKLQMNARVGKHVRLQHALAQSYARMVRRRVAWEQTNASEDRQRWAEASRLYHRLVEQLGESEYSTRKGNG